MTFGECSSTIDIFQQILGRLSALFFEAANAQHLAQLYERHTKIWIGGAIA
jgi:hypothetical protein